MSQYYNYHPTTGKKLSSLSGNVYEDEDGNKVYENPVVGVNLILLNSQQEILLVERANDPYKGSLDFPGGFMEKDETGEQTARREVGEELGIEVEEITYFSTITDVYPREINKEIIETPIISIMYFSILKSTPTLTISNEVVNPKFYKFSEIPSNKLKFKTVRDTLKDFEKQYVLDDDVEDLVNFHLD